MAIVDLEKILAPISIEQPSGSYMLYESLYDDIRENIREDKDLPQGVWQTDIKKSDWNKVEELTLDALETVTKDLQLAAWLAEAMMNLRGFEGLYDGLKIINELSMAFWESIYPPIEEDDFDFRCSPLVWLNEKVSMSIKNIPITSIHDENYTWNNWEFALHSEALAKKDPVAAKKQEEVVSHAKIVNMMMLSPIQFYINADKHLKGALEEIYRINQFWSEMCGNSAPSLTQLKDSITTIHKVFVDILKDRTEEFDTTDSGVMEDEYGDSYDDDPDATSFTGTKIKTRADAYRMLDAAAEYLARIEPHSPTPYLVKRAVAWGNMNAIDVFQELVENKQQLQDIFKLLGMKR